MVHVLFLLFQLSDLADDPRRLSSLIPIGGNFNFPQIRIDHIYIHIYIYIYTHIYIYIYIHIYVYIYIYVYVYIYIYIQYYSIH